MGKFYLKCYTSIYIEYKQRTIVKNDDDREEVGREEEKSKRKQNILFVKKEFKNFIN